MNFYYSLSDPLTIAVIAVCLLVSLLFIKEVAVYVRDTIPWSVKCWFCHFVTHVHYKSLNNWVCPKCDQYNGFSKDGDYNKFIPNQYDSKLNNSIFAQQNITRKLSPKHKLCKRCNLKQELKIQQLASFVPMSEKNYDREVEHFQKQIEKNFALCQNCDALLSKVLQNLREELSLPKRLTAAVLKVNIRGERAICINLILSFLLALTSFKLETSSIHSEIQKVLQTFSDDWIIFFNHPWISIILTNAVQILIGTGILTNSLGFYQTNSPAMFLNIVSWLLMFFLTLYPDGFEELINILKLASSLVSVTISVILLLKNRERRNRKKTSLWEKKNTSKTPLMTSPSAAMSSRLPSPTSSNTSLNNSNPKLTQVDSDDSPGSISSSLSNLSLGIRQRRDIKRPNPKPIITPPKFNPFNKSPSEKSYHVYGKPGPCSFSHYEPSLTPPSVYEGYDPTESIATIPSYGYQQHCYPCSPTLAYYVTTPQYPKIMSVPDRFVPPSTSSSCNKERHNFWMFIQSVPTVVLIMCNLVILYEMFIKPNPQNLLRT